MELKEKIEILGAGAKFDVSCSSSGSSRGAKAGQLGSGYASGICHAFTEDGRCVSLFKILMSNACSYNCSYCACRKDANIKRATLTPAEICETTMELYRRNYIEGLFLSSAVAGDANFTMQQLFETVKMLREQYHFNGYIHLKAIPGACLDLIEAAGKYADRMSANIELPSEESLKNLAPDKSREKILGPMRRLTQTKTQSMMLEYGSPSKGSGALIHSQNSNSVTVSRFGGFTAQQSARQSYLPAGQTTQMIIGASPEPDSKIVHLTEGLYQTYKLKRVYYSAYTPVGDSNRLPTVPPDLVRENRLYQADWLLRFYNFRADEIISDGQNLDRAIDPKCAWALKNIGRFPIEVNTAPVEELMRVPGIGILGASRIEEARRHFWLGFEDLKRMRIVMRRAQHFITCKGTFYGLRADNIAFVRQALLAPAGANLNQLNLFDALDRQRLITGEI